MFRLAGSRARGNATPKRGVPVMMTLLDLLVVPIVHGLAIGGAIVAVVSTILFV